GQPRGFSTSSVFFSTDRFLSKRLNIYSSLEILSFIQYIIRGLSLRKIFNLPACQHHVSCKLIHFLFTRHLLIPSYLVFKSLGQLRVFLVELFQLIMNPSPTRRVKLAKIRTGKSLLERRSLSQLLNYVTSSRLMIFLFRTIPCPTPKYFNMVKFFESFLQFPWDRESSFKTTYFIKPSKLVSWKGNDPIRTLVRQLKQGSLRLHRFPLSLQFLAFHAFKKFQSKIHAPFGQSSIMDFDDIHLPQHRPINLIDILCMEAEPNASRLHGVWPDELTNEYIIYIKKRIADHQPLIRVLAKWRSHLKRIINAFDYPANIEEKPIHTKLTAPL
ncbi:LOW QUALITY PROTEIN: hypothetical protein HID58_055421, partial [Brassica napus]